MLVGRKQEIELLRKYHHSSEAEFLAVYGRRRVGKTYLIRQFFNDEFFFYATGVATENDVKSGLRVNLECFGRSLNQYGVDKREPPQSWMEAFDRLSEGIKKSRTTRKKVIFLDEMPWMDTPKSGFIQALEYFWNSFASARSDVLVIACGSAAAWMTRKVFNSKGGLHNRITGRLLLRPFTLGECEEYFRARGIVIDRKDIAEAYMIFGGIPYYLSYWDGRYGLSQNVDRIVFKEDAPLKDEFINLYASLFASSVQYIDVIKALSVRSRGLSREEILKATGLAEGGAFSEILQNLEMSGFIRHYALYPGKARRGLYQLIDNFSLFHQTFVEGYYGQNEHFWSDLHESPRLNAWRGYAFEQLCFRHIEQIKWALGIAGISADVYAWRSVRSDPAAQIDLIISRADKIVNLCEMKFAKYEFEITKDYAEKLRNKVFAFGSEAHVGATPHLTFITTYGIKRTGYAQMVQSEVLLDDLFTAPLRK
ncbi:MAG: ATP-binding protein [Coriobacteriia bacterium]|nr:ATP-binding protein [Coriobacteriia bacterium]